MGNCSTCEDNIYVNNQCMDYNMEGQSDVKLKYRKSMN